MAASIVVMMKLTSYAHMNFNYRTEYFEKKKKKADR